MSTSFSHTYNQAYLTDAGAVVSTSVAYTGAAQIGWTGTIAHGVVKQEIDAIAFVKSTVRSLLISSTKAVTVYTNVSGSPVDTIAVAAGKPVIWNTDSSGSLTATLFPNGEVTKIFISNAGGTSAFDSQVEIRVLTTI